MTSPTQNDCHSFQLIDGKGEFNEKGLRKFITATNLSKCGVDYAVIAIIGPQSSGKSTFMNHFGGTNFKEMNSKSGRNQTTQGIWIANCVTIHRPFTIVMDIEGTDGEERGEDDTAFEGQSALFGLAVADILIVNLWCHDIGRQKAASTTLLQTVLQIRMRMDRSRKVKLCFILRDYTHEDTPLEILEEKIKSTMEKIWTTMERSNSFERTNMSDFFYVLVFGLPHYKFEKKEFENRVAELREKILSVDREGVVPAVAFQENAQRLWKSIKEEPFLNLPAHSEMIAEHMCKEIANTCRESLTSSEDLTELKKEVEAGPVCEFGDELHCLMETTLSKYRSEVQHFKEHIVKEREKVLKSKILKILHPLYVTNMGHLRNETFQEFKMRFNRMLMKGATFVVAKEDSYDICKRMFERQCKDIVEKLSVGWDWLGCNEELYNEIENYASSIRSDITAKLKKKYQDQVADYITTSLEYQLQNCTEDTYWASSIREVVRMSTSEDSALISNFSSAVATYWEDISLRNKMIQELKTYARNVIVGKLRAEVDENVVNRMIIRFGSVFCWDEDSTKRDWVDQNQNVEAIRHESSAAAIKLLSVMAVVQFDEKSNNCIEGVGVLLSSLMDANSSKTYHLDKDKWEGVSEDDTIIAPWKCKSLWNQFNDTTEGIVKKIMSDMENIKWMKGKATVMQVMSVLSAYGGPMVLTAGAIALAVTPVGIPVAVMALVARTAGAMPVMALFGGLAQYFENEKHKARQNAIELEKKQQRCHERFQRDTRKCKSLWSQFKDTTEDIVKEVMSDMENIKRVKGKETGMQAMSVPSVGAGVTAGILLAGAAMTGGLPLALGAVALEVERHQQGCHKLFRGGQPSLQ